MEGTIIGQYRIVRRIGAGGMGAVYLAEHTLVGRRAAVKVLLPHLSVRREIVARFFNEARAMASIPDPGIVQMFDFGFHTDGSAYIVMELLEGETLGRRCKRLGRLELIDALRIVRQIAGSLAAAHASGVVHRDLKPDNVFLVRDAEAHGGERPKVLDFGIAKLSGDGEGSHTLTGAVMGTPVYMSPEQCRGTGAVDARSDIYSLGCVLFGLVTGRPPFRHAGAGELISAHMNDAPPRPSELAADLPAELDDVVLRCLAKSPDARYPTMLDVQAACDGLLARLSSTGAALPAYRSAPPALPPAPAPEITAGADVAPAPGAMPTTLSSAVGATVQPSSQPRTRRIGVWIGFGGTLIAAGIATLVGMSGGSSPAAPPSPIAASPVAAPSVAEGAAAPSPAAAPEPTAAPAPTAAPRPAAVNAMRADAGVELAAPADAAVAPADRSRRPPARPTPDRRRDEMYDDR